MKSYLKHFKIQFITNLQYRSAAIAGVAAQVFFGFVYIMVYIALYNSNKGADLPMNLNQMIDYIWIQQAFYSLIIPYVRDSQLINNIKSGNIACELVRPQDFYFKNLFNFVARRMCNALLRFPPIIVLSLLLPEPYRLSIPTNLLTIILFILSILVVSVLSSAINLFVHIIVMFTKDEIGIFSLFSVMIELLSGSLLPLVFFPTLLKKIAYALPFRYLADFPINVYIQSTVYPDTVNLLFLSVLWMTIIILGGYLLTKLALKKAVIQGG